jgi:hypothetical protein
MPRFRPPLLALAAGSLVLPCVGSASAEVILDFSRAPGFTVGDQFITNQSTTPALNQGTTSATFTLDDTAATSVTLNATYTGSGIGTEAATGIPLLRSFSNGGLGIDSAVGPASNDDTTAFDEQGAVATATAEESLILSFSEDLFVTAIALAKFDSETETGTTNTTLDVVGITANGTTTTYASDSSQLQTVNFSGEDQDVLVFATPISLSAGDTLTFFTADNGDAATKATVAPSGLFVSSVPEPGTMALLALGGSLVLARRRADA